MAEIKKRGSKWQYRVFYTDPATEKQKSVSKSGFLTKAQAMSAAREMEVSMSHGASLSYMNITFADYYDRWIRDTKLGHYSHGTENRYEATGRLIRDNFSGERLRDVSRREYTAFILNYSKNHARESVKKVNSAVRGMIRDALAERVMYSDFTLGVKNTGQPGKDVSKKYLNEQQLHALLVETKKHMHYPVVTSFEILIAAFTGARYEELAALTWDRVNWETSEVTFDRAYDYAETKKFKPMKNQYSPRTIKINAIAFDALKELRAQQAAFYLKHKIRDDVGFVFRGLNGHVPTDNAANKFLTNYETKAGIPKSKQITFHGLRHTHASYLISNGANISYVSKRLGHKNIAVTMEVYSHLLQDAQQSEDKKAMQLLDNIG
ncbi:MAG: site-specific integrase [Schleiferilactobacillus harbinensis]|jgi:integrase|nr:site-specific integrase [Schleiferilactobacillus harbinensis]